MRGSKRKVSVRTPQRIPRVSGRKAAEILMHCDRFLADSKETLTNLPRVGFAQLLATLNEDVLRLALQPDSWGERMRARLMSDIAPALQGDVAGKYQVSVDDIAYCANIVTPCLLLELGRRLGHLQIEFPLDPTDSTARFKVRNGATSPVHSIDNRQLVQLVHERGPDLVGLCFFGDQESREAVEAELEFGPDRSRVPSAPAGYKQ